MDNIITDDSDTEDIKYIADSYSIDKDSAERVLDIMNEYGVDEDEAVEIEELGLD